MLFRMKEKAPLSLPSGYAELGRDRQSVLDSVKGLLGDGGEAAFTQIEGDSFSAHCPGSRVLLVLHAIGVDTQCRGLVSAHSIQKATHTSAFPCHT